MRVPERAGTVMGTHWSRGHLSTCSSHWDQPRSDDLLCIKIADATYALFNAFVKVGLRFLCFGHYPVRVDIIMAISIRLMPISSVPSLSTEQRAELLDTLFEKCTQLHTLSVSDLHNESFTSYADLINYVRNQLVELNQSDLESDAKWLEAILSAHPRLGEKKVDSAMSRQEQAGLKDEKVEETEKLMELNKKYEEKFPGLRYV